MSILGDHGGFIVAAYLAVVVVLASLVAWIVLDGRALKRRLADLEARGIRRRSAKGDER
jgi:heme exporter protein D